MIMIIRLVSESLICWLEKPPDGAWAFGNHWHLHGEYADSIGKLEHHQPKRMANYSGQLKALETRALPSQRSHFGTHYITWEPGNGLDMELNGPTEAYEASNGAYGWYIMYVRALEEPTVHMEACEASNGAYEQYRMYVLALEVPVCTR